MAFKSRFDKIARTIEFDFSMKDFSIEHPIQVPISKDGVVVGTTESFEKVSVGDHYKLFDPAMFSLTAQLEAGVPLEKVNINYGISHDIKSVECAIRGIDNARAVLEFIDSQKLYENNVESVPDNGAQN